MYIIVVGAGEVGSYLAEILVEEGHDIAVIERDPKLARALEGRLDALIVCGSGLDKSKLEDAGIKRADLVLAVTEIDEVNLVVCMTATKFGRSPLTVARVRKVQYQSQDSALSAQELGLSLLVSPEVSIANEVIALLTYDGAGDIHYLCNGKLALLELPVTGDSPLGSEMLKNIADDLPPQSLIAAISDDNGLRIPSGEDVIGDGARAHVLTIPDNAMEFSILSGVPWHHVKHVLLIGCGDIGFHLAKQLEKRGLWATIIEIDEARAEWVSGHLRKSVVLCGDGTDPDLLREQLEEVSDAVVVLLEDDEKALLVGLFAKHLGAKKVIVRSDKPAYAPIGRKMGLDAMLTPKRTVADDILRFARRGNVTSAHMLGNHEAELLEIEIDADTPEAVIGQPIAELEIPAQALVGAIVRGDEVLVPRGDTKLQIGDHLLIVGKPQDAGTIMKFFG